MGRELGMCVVLNSTSTVAPVLEVEVGGTWFPDL